ncbi:DUF645 family protein [Vibrio cholerae]|nr:DUF645 family protein [Vibrio cholerae]
MVLDVCMFDAFA